MILLLIRINIYVDKVGVLVDGRYRGWYGFLYEVSCRRKFCFVIRLINIY